MTIRRACLLALLALVLTGCAVKTRHPLTPDRYYLPYVPDAALLCVQQPSSAYSCIRAGDLRKLLASMGHA